MECIEGEGGECPERFVCSCAPGFEGLNCEINIDDCVSQPCLNGVCVDATNDFECLCRPG